jgi:hypothetical protein
MAPTKPLLKNGFQWPVFAPAKPAYMPSLAITPDQVRGRLWAQRLKRVFNIDIETCDKCGGDVRINASIEDPAVIRTLLAYLNKKWVMAADNLLPDCRASPSASSDLLI